jgi:uncharacterized protein (DUF1697 family)
MPRILKMPTYIALLRGINVGGCRQIKMADLHAHFAAVGASNVRTYIQSGNVIFHHRATTSAAMKKTIERHLAEKLGYAVATIVKTADELARIAAANPYDTGLPDFGKRMYVCFFEKAPSPNAIQSIFPLLSNDERLVVTGDAGYAYYAAGLGRAKLTGSVIERKLGLATLRNWNTVTALLRLATV